MFELLSILALTGIVAASPLRMPSEKRECQLSNNCIAVIDSTTNENYGYLGTTLQNGAYVLVSEASECLLVETNCEGDGLGQIISTNNGDPQYNYLTVYSQCGESGAIEPDSENWLWISQGTETSVGEVSYAAGGCLTYDGSTPVPSPLYWASGVFSVAESTDPEQPSPQVEVTWINPDGSTVSPSSSTLFWWPSQNIIGLTGDWTDLSDAIDGTGDIIHEIGLFLVLP